VEDEGQFGPAAILFAPIGQLLKRPRNSSDQPLRGTTGWRPGIQHISELFRGNGSGPVPWALLGFYAKGLGKTNAAFAWQRWDTHVYAHRNSAGSSTHAGCLGVGPVRVGVVACLLGTRPKDFFFPQ